MAEELTEPVTPEPESTELPDGAQTDRGVDAGEAVPAPVVGALPRALPRRRKGFLRVRERLGPAFVIPVSLLPFVAILAWWVFVTQGDQPELRRISTTILPSPEEVIASFDGLWHDSALARNMLKSLERVLAGFGIAAAIALPLGIAMGSFSRIGAVFGLFATAISYIPVAAIVPLTIAWWGTAEKQKMGFLALATFAYLLPMVVRQISAVDHQYLLSAYAQGASYGQVVRRVLVPIALPGIYNSMRLCLGIGWTYIILAEVIGEAGGLRGAGGMIINFQRRQMMSEIYLTLVAIMLVGAVMDRCVGWAGKQLFPYRAGQD